MKNVAERTDNTGRTEYVVKGTDGWNLVTHDRQIAQHESQKTSRDYGDGRISSGRSW